MGTGSFPGVKRSGRGADDPSPSSAEVEGRVEMYIYPLWAFVACSRESFIFTYTDMKIISEKTTMAFRSIFKGNVSRQNKNTYSTGRETKQISFLNEEDRSEIQRFEVFGRAKTYVYCCFVHKSTVQSGYT